MWARAIKTLHQRGAIGVMGSLACCVVLVSTASQDSLAGYAAVRAGIDVIARWVLISSILFVLVSGLLALVATEAYKNSGRTWAKSLLGLVMFEGTLLTIQSSGVADPAAVAPLLRTEWGGLWTMLALSLANIVWAVWRPRFAGRAADPDKPTE